MAQPNGAVFLSYASEDAAAAQRIATALRDAGIEVWFDKSELRGGDAWDRKIREQIHDCALFIPIISAHSNARLEGYFRREWRLAVERTHDMAEELPFLLPVVIDETTERAAHVPDAFRHVQWTRAPGGATPPAFAERVRRLLSPDHQAATAQSRSAAGPMAPARPRSGDATRSVDQRQRLKYAMALIVGALVFAGGYVAVERWLGSKQSAQSAQVAAPTASPPSAIPEKSIAVLPFIDLSEKHDQAYFADGLAEEVIDQLSRVPGLRVVGRTSSFQFRGKAVDTRTIGTTLNAAYVLEGSVRRSGDRIRATAQLISTLDGTHRFSETYDEAYGDAFKLQDSIANDLARTLQVAVATSARNDPLNSNPDAYDLFLKGMQSLDSNSEDGTNKAVALFTEAARLEPRSGRGLAALAEAYSTLGEEGWMSPDAAFGNAQKTAQDALRVDQKNAMAHEVLAKVAAVYEWNWRAADREITSALELGGRDPGTLNSAAQIASAEAHWERALEYAREAVVKDPLSADAHMVMGAWVYSRTQRYEEAETSIRRGLQIRPHWGTGRYFLSTCLLMQGKLSDALQEAQDERPRDGRYQATSAALFAMHRKLESDHALQKAIEVNQADWPSSIARLYAFRGERDQAIKWLERAYVFRDEDLYFIKSDPLLKNLESDPRYKAFLRKMNLPE